MTLTVLFDLDDTLLNTNMGDFLPAYFQGLGQALAHLGSQQTITRQIRFAVDKMVCNRDPSRLLREIFAENFYPSLGTSETECAQRLSEFYAVDFPKLQSLVQAKPEAQQLINECRSQGFNLAIATNPLFPETATRQRIRWAGLDPNHLPFFSSYDNFHFTKPNLSYYAEVIGRLGWPEGPIIMVGDSVPLDLLPAEQMGLHTFWVALETDTSDRPHGSLTDLRPFLANLKESDPSQAISEAPEVLTAILRSTPAVMDSWLKTTATEALHRALSRSEWSANEIFWHLADFEARIYQPQWQQLLTDPDQVIPHIETSTWDQDRKYHTRHPEDAWQYFYQQRMASLKAIETLLQQGSFDRIVDHAVFSKTRISELVAFTAKHDRLHLRQCAEVLLI